MRDEARIANIVFEWCWGRLTLQGALEQTGLGRASFTEIASKIIRSGYVGQREWIPDEANEFKGE